MSVQDYRERLRALIDVELYGDVDSSSTAEGAKPARGGIVATVLSGALREHHDYCRMTGAIHAYETCLKLMDVAYKEIFDPTPTEEKKDA